MKRIAVFCLLFCIACQLFPDFADVMVESDALNRQGSYQQEKDMLLSTLGTGITKSQEAEVYWRLSRLSMLFGDRADERNEPKSALYDFFQEGEDYGRKAMALDPDNHLGYFWTASNVGRWAQVNMGIRALRKSRIVRDLLAESIEKNSEYALAYFALAQMYKFVPGKPISFGSVDSAVSLARRGVDLYYERLRADGEEDHYYGYEIELALNLQKRDWDLAKRRQEQPEKSRRYQNADSVLEKNVYYEGIVEIEPLSDRDEAEAILRRIIESLNNVRDKTDYQESVLRRSLQIIESWEN